ncbi:MAG TPA: flagellar biosynthesis protein FlhB [Fimbriimonadaceae bacterium]|jgi:flagellar biosynthetic protein FlhB
MPDSPAGEKTEEATPKRRSEARKKGTVAKSQELTSAVVIIVMLMALPGILGNLGNALMQSLHHGYTNIPTDLDRGSITRYGWGVLMGPLAAILPLFAIAMLVGLGMNFAQVGFQLSGQAMIPNFQRLNPAQGIKRLFSPNSVMEGAKACLKTGLFAFLAWTTIQAHWNDLLSLGWANTSAMFLVIATVMHQIFLKVAIAWLVLAGIDYYFQRKQVDKQLRMTKQEVKQEMKDMEQSPQMRGAIARKRRMLSRSRMLSAVKTADVIVTNPTHFSVAIKYESGKMYAPQVVAKGADLVALKIREIAGENKVPIVPNPPLARQLYKKCEVGDFVPREMFQAVAEVLAFVYRTMKKRKVA